MLFDIEHSTTYRYDGPVRLGPHVLRLTPRTDASQRLLSFTCDVRPRPVLRAGALDAGGNLVEHLWFSGETTELLITCKSRTETLRDNPYAFVVDERATCLPVSYSPADAGTLAPCLDDQRPAAAVTRLAAELAAQAGNQTLDFIIAVNQYLYHGIQRTIRAVGAPQQPADTLQRRSGSCRDLVVLFMALCRSQGVAARFVSGYQGHAERPSPRRYLHAWAEVYLPGGGWRGYDPSRGIAVSDDHVALVASWRHSDTLPVAGSFFADGICSEMDFRLTIETSA
jgi:transglutaminase-like putative cysteine protease